MSPAGEPIPLDKLGVLPINLEKLKATITAVSDPSGGKMEVLAMVEGMRRKRAVIVETESVGRRVGLRARQPSRSQENTRGRGAEIEGLDLRLSAECVENLP